MRLRNLWLPLIFVALLGCGNDEGEVELTDSPTLFIDRNTLFFDTEFGSGTYVGATTFNTLIVENRGRQELVLNKVSLQAPSQFTLRLPQDLQDGKPLRLQSRQQAFIEVAFRPTEAKAYEGKLRLESNDSQAATQEVALTAKGVPAPAQ